MIGSRTWIWYDIQRCVYQNPFNRLKTRIWNMKPYQYMGQTRPIARCPSLASPLRCRFPKTWGNGDFCGGSSPVRMEKPRFWAIPYHFYTPVILPGHGKHQSWNRKIGETHLEIQVALSIIRLDYWRLQWFWEFDSGLPQSCKEKTSSLLPPIWKSTTWEQKKQNRNPECSCRRFHS